MEVGLAFGKVLRRRRVEAGFTQEQLVHEAELQRNYVSLMERGINQPTITTLIKLAKLTPWAAPQLRSSTRWNNSLRIPEHRCPSSPSIGD
ncbi:helix-turn-helix domain-containing protein [Pseudomonas aeruginosa]|uniref:helix-turn-helix domain-containing protein n=1 Tax=Pseudomonas aeruginosa TaxID=287 RepID=UPI001E469F9B|nr:helix-turn-helix transcriptional regulator [Pseudomonas aeruginosa]